MTTAFTEHWLDLFSMILDRLADHLADPAKAYERLGLDTKDPNIAKNMPQKMAVEKYKDLSASWRRVRTAIRSFGLAVTEDMTLAPLMSEMGTKRWRERPWLHAFNGNEIVPLKFEGRDALTALSFFNFFVQSVERLDPQAHVKKALEAQGITKDNFHQHEHLLEIKNPWSKDN